MVCWSGNCGWIIWKIFLLCDPWRDYFIGGRNRCWNIIKRKGASIEKCSLAQIKRLIEKEKSLARETAPKWIKVKKINGIRIKKEINSEKSLISTKETSEIARISQNSAITRKKIEKIVKNRWRIWSEQAHKEKFFWNIWQNLKNLESLESWKIITFWKIR